MKTSDSDLKVNRNIYPVAVKVLGHTKQRLADNKTACPYEHQREK